MRLGQPRAPDEGLQALASRLPGYLTLSLLFLSLPSFPVLPLPTSHGLGSRGILFDSFVLILAPLPQAEGGNTALKTCVDTW